MAKAFPKPTNNLVTPLLTDLYQITMAYAYWKTNRHRDQAVFELFFRKSPFGGEYTIFCGLDEVLKLVSNFSFSQSDLDYLRTCPVLSHCDPLFFDEYLSNLDCSEIKLYSMTQGQVVFPRVPLITVVGPLGIAQLLETALLNLVNYPSLVATNAARMCVAARGLQGNDGPKMAEFGLRRAQGPDGGFSASKYSIIGGFDATANVQAGKLLGVPIVGTHAHSFVMAHSSLEDVADLVMNSQDGTQEKVSVLERTLHYRKEILGGEWNITNDGELAAFISYAVAFPDSFLCLVDTYDTLASGVLNFILVALVLLDLGYTPRGIRLDSGDLAYFSLECKSVFEQMAVRFNQPLFQQLDIVASNDINEESLYALNKDGHAITVFGVGTNLVTCQAQPALGCVYKLVELNGKPRLKLSENIEKMLIPGRKEPYRLYGQKGWPLLDLMVGKDERQPPVGGERILCRHPFFEQKRVAVVASKIVKLHTLVFDGEAKQELPTIGDSKRFAAEQIKNMRPDLLRKVDPGKYKVSVTEQVFRFLLHLWQSEVPVLELR